MKNEITIYKFADSKVQVFFDNVGNPWWLLREILDALEVIGTGSTSNVTARLDKDEFSNIGKINVWKNPGREPIVINEPGLYKVVLRSNSRKSDDFIRWVTHEVLPSIRKTGTYSLRPSEAVIEQMKYANDAHEALSKLTQSFGMVTLSEWYLAQGLPRPDGKVLADLGRRVSEYSRENEYPIGKSILSEEMRSATATYFPQAIREALAKPSVEELALRIAELEAKLGL